MGIPRLRGHLLPYVDPTILGCKTNHCHKHVKTKNFVIDGPSLAFHIYYKVLALKGAVDCSLDAVPTCSELGKATITFLDQLQQYGGVMYNLTSYLQLEQSAKSIF